VTRILVALFLSLPLIGAYGILSVGIVMIYRASRVLNLAHGAMMMVPPFVLYSLVNSAHIPLLIAIVPAIASGALLGIVVERIFIRTLRDESPTAQTVGTVAALALLIALSARVWGTTSLPVVGVFPEGRVNVALSSIRYGEIALFVVMLAVTGGLIYLFQHTDLGLMMRGSAENRRAAALMGVNPERATLLAWALGGTLAALTGILLASITNLNVYDLSRQALPGFVAALLGGMGSMTAAVGGAAVVGITQGLVPAIGPLGAIKGAPQLFLFVVAVIAMTSRGRRIVGSDIRESAGFGARGASSREASALKSEARPLRERPLFVVAVLFAAVFPWLPGVPYSVLGNANRAAQFALVAVALVILTGWVGQISLGHAAFVGIGAYATGWLAGGFGIPFPLNIPFAALAAAVVASILGVVAVRVRGLFLAVATMIFSWMADAFLFRQDWVISHAQIANRPIGDQGAFPFFDFADRRVFYMISWALLGLAILVAANLKQSKTGRAFFAVRGSEMAAASLGIDVVRYKVIAFALSGLLAGVAGNLAMSNSRTVVPEQFLFNVSFFVLSVAVVGGLRSLGGAVAAGLLFASLTELFFRVAALGGYLDLVSAGLLVAVLLLYPEGLAAVPDSVARALPALRRIADRGRGVSERLSGVLERSRPRRASRALSAPSRALRAAVGSIPVVGRAATASLGDWSVLVERAVERSGATPTVADARAPRRRPEERAMDEPPDVVDPEEDLLAFARASASREHRFARGGDREARTPLIEAQEVTVRFGGLVAVDGASMTVREGEIVGLIGPNGAGKTTLFNGIAGLVDISDGTVRLFGQEVNAMPVHERARLGVARTFQLIQLFQQLTVFDNLLVATHMHNHTGLFEHVLATRHGVDAEVSARRHVTKVIREHGLQHVAEARVADLPFGVLRMVEVARALVTDFPVVMLDEPASGLDNRETDVLAQFLLDIRDRGVTLLLIEHDVAMVTAVSDYIYVLDRGKVIAQGPPDKIKRDPAVIAAYLGTESTEKSSAAVG
jgi:ABC-type branched-subunit amino acid transport system ATPase component/branched-subunit amino acid ABC-type transport system permease component